MSALLVERGDIAEGEVLATSCAVRSEELGAVACAVPANVISGAAHLARNDAAGARAPLERGEELAHVSAMGSFQTLAEGMLVADTVRCPWHHACFSLRTGEALRAPALDPVACWRVDQQDGKIYVRDKLEPAERGARTAAGAGPDSIVIIGGGAAGSAAAEMLRREGYSGPVTMLSADDAGPYDRPNLSKDYLAGNAPEEWIPLRSPDFYREHGIELKLGARAVAIDPKAREVRLADGSQQRFGALLLATGAEPVHPAFLVAIQPRCRRTQDSAR